MLVFLIKFQIRFLPLPLIIPIGAVIGYSGGRESTPLAAAATSAALSAR